MSQTYSKHLSVYTTPEMYQFLQLLAERHKVSISDVVRQAVREYLDEQEDVISSRSRLGRTVMRQLGIMHHDLLTQLITLSKLMLAAVLILLAEQGIEAGPAIKRILGLAGQPALDKLVRGGK